MHDWRTLVASTDREQWLYPREAEDLLTVTRSTLDRYVARGILPCRTLPSGHRRFRREDVEALLVTARPAVEVTR